MTEMLTCPRCKRRESRDQDYHVLCSVCYEFFTNWHGSTEDTVNLYRAWYRFLEQWEKADRDNVVDFTESKGFWDFEEEAFKEADYDLRHNFIKKQIERMKE